MSIALKFIFPNYGTPMQPWHLSQASGTPVNGSIRLEGFAKEFAAAF